MTRLNTYFTIIASLIFLAGCSTYYNYPQVVSPHAADIPLIKEKGELKVDVGGSFTGVDALRNSNEFNTEDLRILPSVHGTISYGMSNRFALQMHANLSVLSMYYLQTALGLFNGFGNKSVVELYGGYGYGSSIYGNWMKTNSKYHLPFVQFNIGQTGLGALRFDYGLGIKAGYIYAHILSDSYYYTFLKDRSLLVEPCVFFRFGGRKVKFSMRANYFWTNCDVKDDYYLFSPFKLSMGANFIF